MLKQIPMITSERETLSFILDKILKSERNEFGIISISLVPGSQIQLNPYEIANLEAIFSNINKES
jgi:hypothetical protein